MRAGRGRWIAKAGARACQAIGLRAEGLGIAIKVADGSARAVLPVAIAVLDALGSSTTLRRRDLEPWRAPVLHNARGTAVGQLRPRVVLDRGLGRTGAAVNLGRRRGLCWQARARPAACEAARAPDRNPPDARLPVGRHNNERIREERDRLGDREVDQQLVERAQKGDKRAFELLVLKYQRKLGRLLSRLVRDPGEVEDVTQEAFIKAYRALPNFRGDSAFYTWLYRIAINTAKNYLVALGRRAPTTTEYDNEEAESFEDAEALRDSATPEGELLGKEIAATVNKAMEALPEDLRTAITLREIEGLSYEEIATVMNCPIGTVRSRIFRAREAIAAELRPLLGTDENRRW
jgi:RNA polymerase sigma-70 factor (ECF subfamily)